MRVEELWVLLASRTEMESTGNSEASSSRRNRESSSLHVAGTTGGTVVMQLNNRQFSFRKPFQDRRLEIFWALTSTPTKILPLLQNDLIATMEWIIPNTEQIHWLNLFHLMT